MGAMPRIRLDLAYDGNAYRGWAAQPGLPTVEGVLRIALETLIRRPVPVTVAGRTDAGVHARRQSVHLDLHDDELASLSRDRDIEPEESLLRRLTSVLGRENGAVVVHSVTRVPQDFDARFSALSRTYTYRIADRRELWQPLRRFDTAWIRQPLDEDLMQLEADAVLGLHDFGSFCRPRVGATTIRQLQDFTLTRGADGIITARLTADAFCHHMVRALIGACMDVGSGRRESGWLLARLDEPSWDEKVRLAPPEGLVLESVSYPEDDKLAARAEQTRAIRPQTKG